MVPCRFCIAQEVASVKSAKFRSVNRTKKTGCHCWQPVFSKPNRSGLFCRLLDDRLQSSGGADLGKLFGAEAEDLFENFVSVLAE